MASDVYERLARFLDDLPAGFPATDSGVELRILRRLFTPEEAELALHLTLLAEPARVIARRARIPVEEAMQRLEEMERKGLMFVYHRDGREPKYMATHFAVGIYEFQVGRLDPELVRDIEKFKTHWFDQTAWDRAPQLRTIPVGESIPAGAEVMPPAIASVTQQMENDPRNVVGKEEELRLIKSEMRTELAHQLLRRIGFFAASTASR